MPKDDLGLEYDEDVEVVLNDPKSTRLAKFLDYRDRRKEAERKKQEEEEAKKKPKDTGVFGGIFS